jgi:glutamyl-tRNA reductase
MRLKEPQGAFQGARELAVLATCNRVEVYTVCAPGSEPTVTRAIKSEVFGDRSSQPKSTLYALQGVDAVRHLCRVASGLDSLVVGEHQIAGQVVRAFRDPTMSVDGTSVLGTAAAVARKAARRVRSETAVGRYPASVSSVAVDIARKELNGLAGRTILIVGAGKAGRLVCEALRGCGAASLTVVNRSPEKAHALADRIGGSVAALEELPGLLVTADLVLTATGADNAVVDLEIATRALRARALGAGPLLVLDLALPNDVDPAVGQLEGLRLLTLEQVKTRVDRHLSLRRDEIQPAESVIDEVMADFVGSQAGAEVEALITELRRDFELVRSREVDRWIRTHPPEARPSREDIDRLTRSIVNKLLHDPMTRLRSSPDADEQGEALFHTARELFGLDVVDVPEPWPSSRRVRS